ncbi:MAG: hypothetical protein MI923_05690 [Phycisphaerales bacterium]|nr:hypothetical protein [Phycisphaerales bacterium]
MISSHTIESIKKRIEGILDKTIVFEDESQEPIAQDLLRALASHRDAMQKGKKGNCGEIAFYLALLEDATLVHAIIHQDSRPIFHAWVEFDEVCVDLANLKGKRYFMKSEIPSCVEVHSRYSGFDLAKLAIRRETDSRWNPEISDFLENRRVEIQ